MIERHGVAYAISSLALLIGLWGARGLGMLSAVPPGLPKDITYPIRIGSPEASAPIVVGSPAEMLFRVQSLPAGSRALFAPAGNAAPRRLVLPRQIPRSRIVVILLSGLLFLLVNFLVFCPRVRAGGKAAAAFYWCTALYGVAILLNGIYFPHGPPLRDAIFDLVWIASLAALPVFFVEMSLSFPRPHATLERRPRILLPLWLAATMLIAWEAAVHIRYFLAPGPATWGAIPPARIAAQVVLVVQVAAGCVILFSRSRGLVLARERQQMKWLLWGFTIGIAPYVFLRTLPAILGLRSPIDPAFDRLFEISIPIAFTCAVVLYRFLDIDVIIRRGLIYSVLAGAMAAVYLLIAVLAGDVIRGVVPSIEPAVPVAAAVVAVALFGPTRRAIARWVDRTFFRIRANHEEALEALRAALHAASRPWEVADLLRSTLESSLGSKGVRVALASGREGGDGAEDGIAALAAARSAGGQGRALAAQNRTAIPEIESLDYPIELDAAGFPILAPIASELDPGFALIGEKVSERRFVREDMELITKASAIAAAALDRLSLIRRAAEEESARLRLEEMNRLKTDFLSRIAHDLRTPLASIGWSAENLLDGVVGPPGERQIESLRAIKTSSDQLNRLVTNLLEASRREIALLESPIEPVDLLAAADEAACALSPAAGARRIRLVLEADGRPFPRVHGNTAKVMEVLNNLIDNALKYSPDGSSVEIGLERCGPDRVRLSIRDHGPGLPEMDGERLFERFRQGRPSPYSGQSGFGLGLYVVRTLMDFMDAAVEARTHPSGGAEFLCTFRIWDATGPDREMEAADERRRAERA